MTAGPPATVIVTGAGSGIGAATARLLADRRADVIVADYRIDAAQQIADEIGGAATAICLDVSDGSSCEALFGSLEESGRTATGLVNNAGVAVRSALVDLDPAEWRRVIDTNLTGAMLMSQLFVRQLRGTAGAIVNVASVMAHFGAPNLSPYIASKGGLAMLTRALAVELARQPVRVNAVSPGYIETGMTAQVFKVPRFAQAVLGRIPMGRFGAGEDVARAIAFLLSDEAAYVTGQVVAVDGGMTAGDTSLATPTKEELALVGA